MVAKKKLEKKGGDKISKITLGIWALTLCVIIILFFVYQDDAGIQTLVLGSLLFWISGTVIPILASGPSNPISVASLTGDNLDRTVVLSLGAGAVFVLLANTFLGSAVQLYSSSQMESLNFFIAVLFFGGVMVSAEENNWGKWVQPTLKKWFLEFRGMSYAVALLLSFVILVLSFGLVHFWFGKVVVSVVVGALLLRTVITVLNEITNSYLAGVVIHRMVQSVALAVIFVDGIVLQVLFVAGILGLTLSPYYVLPKLLR